MPRYAKLLKFSMILLPLFPACSNNNQILPKDLQPSSGTPTTTLTVFAGTRTFGYVDGPAAQSQFRDPTDVVVDKTSGVVYVADRLNSCIRKISQDGMVTTLAGNGTSGFQDGVAQEARFSYPQDIAIDPSGNLYVADSNNHCIRRITPDGTVTTLAGTGSSGFADGPYSSAQFSYPHAVSVGKDGSIYVVETGNDRIRKLKDGKVMTLAGGGSSFEDGTGTSIQLTDPMYMTLDGNDNLYVSDAGARIYRVAPEGYVTKFAGNGSLIEYSDGPKQLTSVFGPLVFDGSNNLLVLYHGIRKIGLTGDITSGMVSTLLRANMFSFGEGTDLDFKFPEGLDIDVQGNIYIADGGNDCIRKLTPQLYTPTPRPTPLFNGSYFSLVGDGVGEAATFGIISGLTSDSSGNLFVTDNRVRKITPSKQVSTFAGGGFGNTDGIGTAARFVTPCGMAFDKNNNLYVADYTTGQIRRVTPSGEVSTFAGATYSPIYDWDGYVDGPKIGARFNCPKGIALDDTGNVYVADTWNHRIRKIALDGTVSTFAGSGYLGGMDYSGGYADGPALSAKFRSPSALAFDNDGNLLVLDLGNNRVRKITPQGVVSTVSGSGEKGFADGVSTDAKFNVLSGIAVANDGSIYVADGRIRKISPSGEVATLAVSSIYPGFLQVTLDKYGNLFAVETNRVVQIQPDGKVIPFAGTIQDTSKNPI